MRVHVCEWCVVRERRERMLLCLVGWRSGRGRLRGSWRRRGVGLALCYSFALLLSAPLFKRKGAKAKVDVKSEEGFRGSFGLRGGSFEDEDIGTARKRLGLTRVASEGAVKALPAEYGVVASGREFPARETQVAGFFGVSNRRAGNRKSLDSSMLLRRNPSANFNKVEEGERSEPLE